MEMTEKSCDLSILPQQESRRKSNCSEIEIEPEGYFKTELLLQSGFQSRGRAVASGNRDNKRNAGWHGATDS
jgi:hypothetical protein